MSAARPSRTLRQLFIVPELRGTPSGGTVYNRKLLAALAALGAPATALSIDALPAALAGTAFDVAWLDTLYLERASAVKAALPAETRFGLLMHYLPTLVTLGEDFDVALASSAERNALASADVALVTGSAMRRALARLRPSLPTTLVTPGCESVLCACPPAPQRGLEALMVAHVVPGKGILELLEALAPLLTPADRLRLHVVGELGADPEYARSCRELVAREAPLRERVSFSGVLERAGVEGALCAANLFVSASRMESYGMALAEARGAGLPILARAGGNVGEHVVATAGGELALDCATLARSLVALARDPAEHARRVALARNAAPRARPWTAPALELLAALRSFHGSC